jgi:beta-lactamase regulating signal transducer with metallopeptidase domain
MLQQYLFQSVLHSMIIALIVEILLHIWKEHRPAIRIRLLFLVLWLPAISIPAFQLINPARGGYQFRTESALFDLNAWLMLRIWNGVLLWHVGAALLLCIALLFLIQDCAVIFRFNLLRNDRSSDIPPKLDAILQRLSCAGKIQCILLQTQTPMLYSSGVRKTKLWISSAVVESMDIEELEGVIAHEMAHITLRDHIVGWILLLFRILGFFNPVALIEFRRILQEREKLCDDYAIRMTGKPMALSSGLIKFFRLHDCAQPEHSIWSQLKRHSQAVRMEQRVQRFVHPPRSEDVPFPEFRVAITILSISILLFYVV